jgi:hypothetical protein
LQIIKLLKLKCEHNKEKRDYENAEVVDFVNTIYENIIVFRVAVAEFVNIINKNAIVKKCKGSGLEHDKENATVKM